MIEFTMLPCFFSPNYNKISHTKFVFHGNSRANDNGSNGPGPVSGSSPSSSNNSSSLSGFASENKMNKSGVIAGVTITVVVISVVVLFIVLRKRRRPHGNYQQLLNLYIAFFFNPRQHLSIMKPHLPLNFFLLSKHFILRTCIF